jgi:hypothetical protein
LQIVQRSPTGRFIGQFSYDHAMRSQLKEFEASKPFQKLLQNRGAATPPH